MLLPKAKKGGRCRERAETRNRKNSWICVRAAQTTKLTTNNQEQAKTKLVLFPGFGTKIKTYEPGLRVWGINFSLLPAPPSATRTFSWSSGKPKAGKCPLDWCWYKKKDKEKFYLSHWFLRFIIIFLINGTYTGTPRQDGTATFTRAGHRPTAVTSLAFSAMTWHSVISFSVLPNGHFLLGLM